MSRAATWPSWSRSMARYRWTAPWLTTGKPPFEARTDMEILLAHREQPIPSLRNCRPDCPAAVEALLRTMVAKRPQDRPASMRAVIAELERLQSPRAGHRPRRWPFLACG